MNAVLLVLAGVYGLVIGSFLNVVAYRVPAGIPLRRESRCPHCEAPIRWWQNVPVVSWIVLQGRCAHCRAPIDARYPLVEALTGVTFVAVMWGTLPHAQDQAASAPWVARGSASWVTDPVLWIVLIAFLFFAAVSIALTLVDLDTRRLPDAIVLPSLGVGIVLLGGAAAVGAATGSTIAGWAAFSRALTAGAILFLFYALVRAISPRGMGGGDVKLAALVGLYLGWCGWSALAVGAFTAFVLGGVFGIVLLLLHRAGRRTVIPFGPWMIVGAWVGIAIGDPLGRWYLGLFGIG